ncbi:MAG: phosphate ABC transporter permease PstA [Gemmatimonadetes bacterium]|nr:MAG: phosphate ABC transporter permease PstA [Gemmatimonadota bacterium]
MNTFWRQGEPFVWLTATAMTVTLLITLTLIGVVMINGLGYFWPSRLIELTLTDGTHVMGRVTQEDTMPNGSGKRLQLKVGNRDLYGMDFRWINGSDIHDQTYPVDAVAVERMEYGDFYGYLQTVTIPGLLKPPADPWDALSDTRRKLRRKEKELEAINAKMSKLNYRQRQIRLKRQKLEYQKKPHVEIKKLTDMEVQLGQAFEEMLVTHNQKIEELRRYTATFADANGQTKEIPMVDIVRVYRPNQMGVGAKIGFYAGKIKELLLSEPRESNTEGGLFPAIFGTVMMVFLMSLFSMPMGVIASIYLREYAKEGLFVQLVRIAVNNLAGVPSIVYGVFGLGFFVYGVGGSIDHLFFPERLPTPTFGTGGILWASLTMALLTVPVVIVATEEGLAAVPQGIREGSLALGATKFQTLIKVVLPMASPGILTGFILAMARAAGEVAPLMIVGVVKLAPALPLDANFPFFHFDRKFMHLGFHIYDIGFQSPNVEAAKPMVYVTTLLLVSVVLLMSMTAIYLRNSIRKKYQTGAF